MTRHDLLVKRQIEFTARRVCNLSDNGKKKKKHQQPPNHSERVSTPPQEPVIKIPNPLPVQIQSSTEQNQQYSDEKSNRDALLRAAQRLNRITIAGAVIAFGSLIILYLSIRQSRQTFEAGQRAWALIDVVNLETPLNITVASPLSLVLKNVGQSPALHVHSDGDERLTGEHCKGYKLIKPLTHTDMPLGPGQRIMLPDFSMGPVKQSCLDELDAGTSTYEVSGTIYYEDIFKAAHKTIYCVLYDRKTKNVIGCPDGGIHKNDAN